MGDVQAEHNSLEEYLHRRFLLYYRNGDLTPVLFPEENSDLERMESCVNLKRCLKYSTNEIGMNREEFGKGFLANYCCRICEYHTSTKS